MSQNKICLKCNQELHPRNKYNYCRKHSEYFQEWYRNNPNYIKDWRKVNPNKPNEYQKKRRINKKKDILFQLSQNLRTRLMIFLKRINSKKVHKFDKYIGCSKQELKQYLESKFQEDMSWNNYGVHGWHIDHIIPLSSAKNEEEIYQFCHYSNLQPLWAKENIKKSNKV